MFSYLIVFASIWISVVNAHLAAYAKGMYCLEGVEGIDNQNSNSAVTPLYQLSRKDWWMHHVNKCDKFPPPDGEFLEIPAGGEFTVEIASNRAKTTFGYNGSHTSEWPDGNEYPEDYNVPTCIISPNMHTQNQSMTAGTAFAISYQSDLTKVNEENLVVFSVKYHTPWKRLTTYSVPALPPCPPGGCTCAWGWIPNGCGEANMYQQPFKCNVTGSTSTTPLGVAKPPVWCEEDPQACTKGPKQMLYWHQNEGNNIEVDGLDLSGQNKSPAYNAKCGFSDGAQNDIFASASANNGTAEPPASSPPATSRPSASSSVTPEGNSTSSTPLSSPTPSNHGHQCKRSRSRFSKRFRHARSH